ncbi:MAG: hypothetical protein ETSY1_11720 [Candidatus Entotheonella factor]|uniref:DUF4440 domain-containing protein n=1 Tax=Entotheonella factor TaxID=1429438 RepID=W4LRG0_ENTF1|nr:MAG: hypothetical protein ETSY1_11720 [Candidatus Entotheonella factor]
MFQPEVRQDAEAVAGLLAEGFVEFGSSGRVYDREATIEALRDEPLMQRSLTQFKTLVLAPGVVLVTYHARRQRLDGRQGPLEGSLRSSIWKLMDGRWQMIFHQGTVARDG